MQSQKHILHPSFNQAQEKRTIFKSANHTNSLSEKLFSLCNNQQLTDICIIGSDGARFNAHKIVLAAGSDLFMAVFGNPLKESTSSEFIIHEVIGETLKPILTFIYTGTIELQIETVEAILRAANFFQIKPLIEECCNFMGKELNIQNCLGILLFAENHDLKELSEKAAKFVCKNLEQVSNNEEFLDLNEDQVILIIRNADRYGPSQEVIFLRLIKWIEHNQQIREQYAFELFSYVKYQFLSADFIKQNRYKLPDEIECLKMICGWYEWHLFSKNTESKLWDPNCELSNGELVFLQEEVEDKIIA